MVFPWPSWSAAMLTRTAATANTAPAQVDARRRCRSDTTFTIARNAAPVPHEEIVLVHSSDLHVDADPHQGPYGDDGTTGLRVVLNAEHHREADYLLLVGDIFENNRQSPG